MRSKENLLKHLEGKTDDEKRELLRENFEMYFDMFECPWNDDGPCKTWHAKVFTYCNSYELQTELNFFLFLVNLYAYFFDFCFNHEDTVSLGCSCPCGNNQIILYYSITYGD